MFKGTTQTGFKFSVDEGIADDMELLEALSELDSGNALAFPRICKLMLGDEQRKALYDHIRDENGRVRTTLMEPELMDIINAVNKGKKSSSSPT